jgi:pyruvate/2-oxoglutarate dehydrogenase complex dihydrolipoamide dehydrogenase (E3) component
MSEELKPDLCIIGAGAGGSAIAAAGAALGVSVVLVEKGPMGGAHLNAGSVPAHALAAAAQLAHDMRESERMGLRRPEVSIDAERLRESVRRIVGDETRNLSAQRFEAMRVKVVRATGRFVSPQVLDAGGVAIRARRFVVATGSGVVTPAIPGIELIHALTTDDVFDLDRIPKRLLVLGAGANGLALAQAFGRLGSKVDVVDQARMLDQFDPELVGILRDRLAHEGVAIHDGVQIESFEPRGTGLRARLADGRELGADDLLIAGPRAPHVGGLGLEAAGVRFDRRGVSVDASLRTSNSRIYAIGDVTGHDPAAHVARTQAGVALRSGLFGLPARFDPNVAPRVVWTDPGIATVGLDETAARAKGAIRILRAPFAETVRARALGRPAGHVKVVTDSKGVLLGVGIVGPDAAEQIGLWQVAIAQRMNVSEIATLAFPVPTLLEASQRTALGALASKLSNPWLGRLLRLLRLKG